MKNLKKILIVIAVLALLASSIAVVVGAEGDAPVAGDVAALEALITEIQSNMSAASPDVSKQASKLADFYQLVADPAFVWDENDPEYQAAIAKAAEYTVTIGNSLYAAYELEPTPELAAKAVVKLHAHAEASLAPESTAGLAELKTKIYEANKKVIGDFLSVSASDTQIRYALISLYEQLAAVPLDADADAELLAQCSTKAYEFARKLMDDYKNLPAYDEVGDTADATFANYTNRISGILLIRDFVNAVDVSAGGDEAVAALVADINTAMAEREAVLLAKMNALDAEASFDSYDLIDIMNKNYNGNLTPEQLNELSADARDKYNAENNLFEGINAAGEWRTEKRFDTIDGATNGYQSFIYGTTGTIPHLYFYHDFGAKAEEFGMVLEFDLRMHERSEGIVLQTVDNTRGTGKSTFETIIVLAADGAIRNDGKTVENKKVFNVVMFDVWQHYTITFDKDKRVGKLYVDYNYIMDIDYQEPEGCKFRQLRFGPSTVSNWRWDIDNIHFYQGNQFRITDKFTSMSASEQFNYFVNFAINETDGLPYLQRDLAYKKAQILVSQFQNSPAANKLLAYDYENRIKIPAMAENLERLRLLVVELDGMTLDSSMVNKITLQIGEITNFVAENGDLINKGDTRDEADVIDPETDEPIKFSGKGYQALMSEVYSKEADLKRIEQIAAFVEAIERFERAQTYAALSRHAQNAIKVYEAAGYSDPANIAFVANDPVVLAFQERYNNSYVNDQGEVVLLDPEDDGYISPDSEEYVTIFEFYDMIDTILENRDEYENSKRIVNGIKHILSLDGYENTPDFWLANRESIETYVAIIRSLVASDAYVEEYPGVDAAIEAYAVMDLFFYELLQQEYVAFLTDLVGGYTETQSYVERRSIINAALVYFDPIENTKDLAIYRATLSEALRTALEDEIEALSALAVAVEVYNRELDGFKDSFEDVLEQQTQYFINTIAHMDTIDNVAELNALFEEASAYYYGINMNVEGAEEAAERYAYYRDYLKEVEEANAYFVLYADSFMDALAYKGAAKRDLLFATINECSQYVDMIDKLDDDVKNHYANYVDAVEEYVAHVLAVNSAIYDSAQFVNAMRSEEISPAVLAIIAGFINA